MGFLEELWKVYYEGMSKFWNNFFNFKLNKVGNRMIGREFYKVVWLEINKVKIFR